MNTCQTVYEQLQEILNKCIDLGWNGKYFYGKDPKMINIMLDNVGVNDKGNVLYMSYHELFSKDSGIMEFVEWVDSDTYHNYICMCEKTAEEKVQYFVNNARPPRI